MKVKPEIETLRYINFLDACDYVEEQIGVKGWADKFKNVRP